MAIDQPTEGPDSGEYEDTYEALDAILYGSEPDQEDLETVYENTGLGMVSNLYGLAQREEQFQDLYTSFRKFKKFQEFRGSHPRREKAYNELIDSFENYMGELSAEEEAEAHHAAAQAATNQEIFKGLSNMMGEITETDMRELLTDIRENMR